AGGSREAYERCLPLLQAAGDHVFYAGGPGTGQATKLVRQYVSFCNFVTEAEALILADKAGLDAAAIATFLGKTLGTSAHRERVMDAMLRRDFGSPDTAASKLDIVAKDLELAVGWRAGSARRPAQGQRRRMCSNAPRRRAGEE